MAQPYVGEIRLFAGSFAPNGWAFCNGQQMAIAENDTLFNLIGTTYGGDGQETFNLPNLSGRTPVHQGTGGGLSNYIIGEAAGVETTTLSTQQIPVHNHTPLAAATADVATPTIGTGFANETTSASGVYIYAQPSGNSVNMLNAAVQVTGGSQPHENMQPFLCISYIISLYGVYPSPT